ncbi:MAG: hypothetical protein IJW42_00495 [Alistipes sp.]|nr:hypothetical protein [Alistipes sp.]
MKPTKILVVALFAAMFCSCATDPVQDVPKCESAIELTATIQDSDARTSLDEESGGVRKVLWDAEDCVALYDDFSILRTLTLSGGAGTNVGTFTGKGVVNFASKAYHVVSPATALLSIADSGVNVSLPSELEQKDGSNVPMVGLTTSDGTINFTNICGFLELQLSGYATLTSIEITSKTKVLSGSAKVSISSTGVPTVTLTGEKSVSFAPVSAFSLSPTVQSVLIPLPAATYPAGDLTITLHATDESFDFVSTKSHQLVRSHIKPISGIYVEASTEYINLSADGAYANCFVASKAGWYMFDVKTKGGFVAVPHPASGMTFTTLGGEGARACVAWESSSGMITDITYDATNGKIIFYHDGTEGNALICLVDANGDSLWNWHIWATDAPQEQTIGENIYLDRNVGAWVAPSSLDEGLKYMHRAWDNAQGAYPTTGLLYQWGRPTPFPGGAWAHLRNSGTYQREDYSVVFANQGVETSNSAKDSARYGDTPTYYFPSEDIIGSTIYVNKSSAATSGTWTNKWWYKNNTNGISLKVAMQNPMTVYGTAADNKPQAAGGSVESIAPKKYWCNDLFAGSFDFSSASAPWNFAAQSKYIFDVCPYGYHVAEAEQAIEDFGTLNLTWRHRNYGGTVIAEGFIPSGQTVYTGAAYATAADGSFVWVPTSGARVFYGAYADQNVINWWGSSSNNNITTIQFAADASASKTAVVKDGYYDLGAGTYTKDGVSYPIEDQNVLSETSISMALAVRCVKDPEVATSTIPIEDLEQVIDGNEW